MARDCIHKEVKHEHFIIKRDPEQQIPKEKELKSQETGRLQEQKTVEMRGGRTEDHTNIINKCNRL